MAYSLSRRYHEISSGLGIPGMRMRTGQAEIGYYRVRTMFDQRHAVLPSIKENYATAQAGFGHQWPLLLTWFNFNPSMDK